MESPTEGGRPLVPCDVVPVIRSGWGGIQSRLEKLVTRRTSGCWLSAGEGSERDPVRCRQLPVSSRRLERPQCHEAK